MECIYNQNNLDDQHILLRSWQHKEPLMPY